MSVSILHPTGGSRQVWVLLAWCCLLAKSVLAQAPSFSWALQPTVTGDGSTFISCDRVATDALGNVYVVGTFNAVRNLRFGGVTLVSNAPPVRIDPSFLVKFSPGGTALWAVATDQRFLFQGLAVTDAGECYVTTRGIAVNPQIITVRKYSSGGSLLTERFAATAAQIDAPHLAIDWEGNVFVMGEIESDANYPAILPSLVLTNTDGNRYLVKYSPSGDALWAMRFGGAAPGALTGSTGLALDSVGNCFVSGHFFDSLFSFSGRTITNSAVPVGGSYPANMFLAKINPAGELLWTQQTGGTGSSRGTDVAVDADGNSYLTGSYVGSVTFGSLPIPYSSGAPMFLVKYDPMGIPQWARFAGGDSSRFLNNRIRVNSAGSCYVVGQFDRESPGIGPTISFGSMLLTSHSAAADVLLAKYDRAGNFQWALGAGGNESEIPNDIALSPDSGLFFGGSFSGVASFGGTSLTAPVPRQMFLARVGSEPPPSAPMILLQPLSRTAIAGDNATFQISVSGAAPLRFQWQLNGTDLSSATNATLIVDDVQDSNAGDYRVVIRNDLGLVISGAATLTVAHRPLITLQPESRIVDPGSTATLSVGAIGTPPLSYRWRYNGTAIGGADASNYTLNAVQLTNAGDYTVVVTNNFGSVTSAVATLNVAYSPFILEQPASQTVIAGERAILGVRLTGTPPFLFQWRLNGVDVSGATNATLKIENVQDIDAGDYLVVITNGLGSMTSSPATLTVVHRPFITVQPQSQTNSLGSPVNLAVLAVGAPPLGYRWYFNGHPLSGVVGTNYAISAAQLTDAGNYFVVVTNSFGSVTSTVAVLVVVHPPSIVAQPVNRTTIAGDTAIFSVGATGTIPLRFQWRFNRSDLLSATNAVLVINSAQDSDAGEYDVIITNSLGSVISTVATLTVVHRPSIVSQPQNQTVDAGSTVTLNVAATGTPPLEYRWYFNGSALPGVVGSSYTVDAAQIFDSGNYFVVVSNTSGAITSAVATLTVLSPPVIVTPPISQQVTAGDPAVFSVVVAGTPPWAIQWLFEGNPLVNATNSTLVISSANSLQAGLYAARVTNNFGAVTSSAGNLTVEHPSKAGKVVTWGAFDLTTTNAAAAVNNAVAVANGEQSIVALTSNGRLATWGVNLILPLPGLSDAVAIAAGASHAVALRQDGGVVAWGDRSFGQAIVPQNLGEGISVACGLFHSLALRRDGTCVAWGRNNYGESTVPTAVTNAVAIGAGQFHSLAVIADGTVVAWGAGSQNSGPEWNGRQSIVPARATNVVAVTGGQGHSVALTRNGRVIAWGDNSAGQTVVPPTLTNAVAIASGSGHNVALRSDGTITMWGWNGDGELNMPPGLTNVIAITANMGHSSAVISDGSPFITVQPASYTIPTGRTAALTVMAAGEGALAYQWRRGGTNLPGAASGTLVLSNVQPADAGRYSAVVTSSKGTAVSRIAELRVTEGSPYITAQPRTQTVVVGTNATFAVTATGTLPISYQWQFRGTNLPGELDSTLTLSTVQSSSAGQYRVVLSNAYGTVTSASATLNVFLPQVVLSSQGQGIVTKSPDNPFYYLGEQVTLNAVPAPWFSFVRWGDDVTANPRLVTVGMTNTFTAFFSPTTAVETLNFSGGSRTAPVGMPAIFVDGQFVVTNALTRYGSARVEFASTFPNGTIGYTLDGSPPSLASSLYAGPFTISRPATIRVRAWNANFVTSWEADPVRIVLFPTYTLDASTAGGGTVTASPMNMSYGSNSAVSLVATPAQGWTFLQWLGDATGANATTTVMMTRDKCVEAVFGTSLSTVAPTGGAVTMQPAAPFYPFGTVVRLTAVPHTGYAFVLWGNAGSGTNNPLLFAVTSSNRTVSAAFAPLSTDQVALTVLVDGFGAVTNNPRSNRFNSGQVVTLTARPELEQQFLNWGGDAGGTQNPLTLTLNASRVITARFTKQPRLSFPPCLDTSSGEPFPLWLTGEWGAAYDIESAANISGPWARILAVTNHLGRTQFEVPAVTNWPARFYRAVGH